MKRQHNETAGLLGTSQPAAELHVWEALNIALDREMERDDAVFILGEDVGLYGGSYRVTQGLYAKYGEWRVRDTPISEGSFTGLGVGAIVNLAAKLRYMSGGQFSVPLVVRMPGGVARQLAAQHSQRLEHTLMNVPGLRIVTPANPQDSYWQLIQAIACDDPVIVLEHELLYFTSGKFDVDAPAVPMHAAAIRQPGKDITLIAWHRMVAVAMEAAEQLATDGIEAEVIDLRSLKPIDLQCLLESVQRTRHAIVVEEDCRFAGAGAEIAASLAEHAFTALAAPVKRVAAADVPTPYNRELEAASIPEASAVVLAVHDTLGKT
jgi:pyruvate dehydrogenase E1 component beta subunit